MVDSDSDAGFDEEIPINSNHERINLDLDSQWNSNRSKHGHHHWRGGKAGKSGKHHQNRTKTGSSYHDTNEYFELAKQARLLSSKGDENTINDPGKQAEVSDRGKGIVDNGTGGSHSQVNGSRFQWSKPFRNRKNKLVRNGCISPENVLRVNGSSHNAGGSSGHSVEQVVGVVDDKGKGKLGLSDCSGAHKSEAGVMLHEHKETRSCPLSLSLS